MKKTLLVISIVLLSIILFCTTVFGTTYKKGDLTMTLVKDEKCHDYFGEDDIGEFTKEKTAFDATNKTIDITLTVKNNAEASQGTPNSAEVLFLIDNSNSMHDPKLLPNGDERTRCELVNQAARELSQKLLASNYDIKIGAIEFAATQNAAEMYDPAATTPQTDYSKDAIALTEGFSNDQSTINAALAKLDTDWWDGSSPKFTTQTNIAAGLKLAQDFFTNNSAADSTKNIIILTDGVPEFVPSASPNPMTSISEYQKRCLNPARAELLAVNNMDVHISNVLIDFESEKFEEYLINGLYYTKKEAAEDLFGKKLLPTAGSNYYVTDSNLITTLTNSIYSNLISQVDGKEHKLNDINIKDYFPQKIVDNFTFSIVDQPTKGTISDSINTADNSITWSIDQLAEGEIATVTYRLTLKDTVQDTAVNVDLPTNEKITITYKENDEPGTPVEDTKTPVVKLTPPTPVANNTVNNTPANVPTNNTPAQNIPVSNDPTIANKTIPQTGTKASTTFISIALITCITLLGVVSYTEYKSIKIK